MVISNLCSELKIMSSIIDMESGEWPNKTFYHEDVVFEVKSNPLRHRSPTYIVKSGSESKLSGIDPMYKIPKKQTKCRLITESSIEFIVIALTIGMMNLFLNRYFSIDPIFLCTIVGFIVSVIATYYKYKVWADPHYKTKFCNCEESNRPTIMHGILTVLDHKKGSLLFNIPNSVFGILFYGAMFGIHMIDVTEIIDSVAIDHEIHYFVNILFVLSFFGSMYLWKTMIFTIGWICILCMTIHAVNFLNLISAVNFFMDKI